MQGGVQWDNDAQTLIRITYEGSWDRTVYEHVRGQFREMLRSSDGPIDIIADFHNVTIPPDALSHFEGFSGEVRFSHPTAQKLVIVWPGRLAQVFFELFSTIYQTGPTKVMLASSLEEAYEMLASTVE